MPNLIGMDYDSVIEAGKVDKVLDIQPEYKFSDEYSKNIIMDQSILEDIYVEEGTKVKVDMRFRGRLITRIEVGRKTMANFIEEVSDLGTVEKQPKLEGNTMSVVIQPNKK